MVTMSEYGLERVAEYRTGKEVGQAVLDAMPEASSKVLAFTQVADDGLLQLTTQLHMRRQRALDMLHCQDCGGFFKGERGLRDHQQVKHRSSYEAAKQAVHDAKNAVVLYAGAAMEQLGMLWEARLADAARKKYELSPGLKAAREGDLETLRRLCAEGWDPRTARDNHGSSALHWAAGAGHLEVCQFLVQDAGMSVKDGQQKDGRTSMHWAARNGRLAVCRWLLEEGAHPDVGTVDGTRPLHWAVWQGHVGVCEWLVDEAGADLHSTNTFGCNAVQWAAQTDSPAGGLPMCRWLLKRGLDLTLLNRNGHSAMHKAAVKGQSEVCRWLLDEAALDWRHMQADGDGNTPAKMAQAEGFDELARWLVQRQQEASTAERMQLAR